MTISRYAMRPDAVEYGPICPDCAGPKHRQSKRCASCYRDARRNGEYPAPPRLVGAENGRWKASGHTGHRATGGPKGRPQPQDHPWRKKDRLLYVKGRVTDMADAGTRPATPGGRVRAHFAAMDEAA